MDRLFEDKHLFENEGDRSLIAGSDTVSDDESPKCEWQ